MLTRQLRTVVVLVAITATLMLLVHWSYYDYSQAQILSDRPTSAGEESYHGELHKEAVAGTNDNAPGVDQEPGVGHTDLPITSPPPEAEEEDTLAFSDKDKPSDGSAKPDEGDDSYRNEPMTIPPASPSPAETEPASSAQSLPLSTPSASNSSASSSSATTSDDPVDWSRFAYTQYVTNHDYLCNSVMIFEALYRLGSKPDRIMMYPYDMVKDLEKEAETSIDARLLIKARDEYDVKLVPIRIQHRDGEDGTWADSYTKLLAFNQTQYDRVLSIDSDGTMLQPLDELFLLPPVPVAMPRAYWLLSDDPPKKILSSQLLLLQPSTSEFERISSRVDTAAENEYDMEVVNDLYLDSALVLPHRPYTMLTAEFRGSDHKDYLGSDVEVWDPVSAYNEARYVHFSDWPVPKPWVADEENAREEMQPECRQQGAELDCTERELWNGLYDDFTERRGKICHSVYETTQKRSLGFSSRRTRMR